MLQAIKNWFKRKAKPWLADKFAQWPYAYVLALLFGWVGTIAMEAPVLSTAGWWMYVAVTIGTSVAVFILVNLGLFPWLRRKSLPSNNRFGRPSKEKVAFVFTWLAVSSIILALALRGVWSLAVFPSMEASSLRVAYYFIFVFLIKFCVGFPAPALRVWLDKLQPGSPE